MAQMALWRTDWENTHLWDDRPARARPSREWKKIAEEASKEKDGTRLLELTRRLIDALDNRKGA